MIPTTLDRSGSILCLDKVKGLKGGFCDKSSFSSPFLLFLRTLFLECVVKIKRKRRLDLLFWGGYTFGWPNCMGDYSLWCSGCVSTPRYLKRLFRERKKHGDTRPVILDNGAYPAWRKGIEVSYEEMRDSLFDCLREYDISWVVSPDVIGSAPETFVRSMRFIQELRSGGFDVNVFYAIQEGFDYHAFRVAEPLFDGFFIGGKTREFKFEMANRYRPLTEKWMHMARVSTDEHMKRAFELGADSFDTTTFFRKQNSNMAVDYSGRLSAYCPEWRDK